MKGGKRSFLVFLGMWFVASAGLAEAGFIEIIGLDPRSAAMGGAATAVADTPSAWYYNPAGLAQIRGSWQELGLSQMAFFSLRERDSESGGWVNGTTPTSYNVHLPGCDNYGLKNVTIGLGGGATFGGGSYWPQNRGGFRYTGYESETLLNTVAPTVAYRVNDWLMIGAGVNILALNKMVNFSKLGDGFFSDAVRSQVRGLLGLPPDQRDPVVDGLLDTLGVNSYNGRDDGKFELWTDEEFPTGMQPTNDMDIDFTHLTYNLGILVKPTDGLRIGVTYREALYFQYEGQAQVVLEEDALGVVNSNPIMLALNGGPVQNESTRFRLGVCMPRQVVAGVSYLFEDGFLLAADFEWTNWSSAWDTQVTYLEGKGLLGLTKIVSQRDFKDTYTARVGAEVPLWKGLRFQAGYWWDPSPVPNHTLDAGTFDSDRHTFSFGLGYYGLFNGVIDLSSVFQYIYFTERQIKAYENVNLGGLKKFVYSGPAYNDFDIEFGGSVYNVGLVVGVHY